MKIDRSIFTDFSKVFLDVVKYVLTGTILSVFIGEFKGNLLMVYIVSLAVVFISVTLYLIFHAIGRK
jgi:hypothetical protein